MATEMKRDHIVTSVKVQCMKKLLLGYCLHSTGSVCLIVAKMFFVKYLDQGTLLEDERLTFWKHSTRENLSL